MLQQGVHQHPQGHPQLRGRITPLVDMVTEGTRDTEEEEECRMVTAHQEFQTSPLPSIINVMHRVLVLKTKTQRLQVQPATIMRIVTDHTVREGTLMEAFVGGGSLPELIAVEGDAEDLGDAEGVVLMLPCHLCRRRSAAIQFMCLRM